MLVKVASILSAMGDVDARRSSGEIEPNSIYDLCRGMAREEVGRGKEHL